MLSNASAVCRSGSAILPVVVSVSRMAEVNSVLPIMTAVGMGVPPCDRPETSMVLRLPMGRLSFRGLET